MERFINNYDDKSELKKDVLEETTLVTTINENYSTKRIIPELLDRMM